MSKRVKITPQLQATIRNALGDPEANTDNFAVFETRMLTTEPLTKGGLWNGARVSASTLHQMEVALNQEAGAIPLHIMHNDRVLPVGKVFAAKTQRMGNGELEVRGQFYLPLDEKELISKIDNSVVDEVSVGILTKHAFCSECNFDYFGPDADIMNFFELTCNKGHKLGQNGVHTKLTELIDFSELSLVATGAAKNPKILPRAKQSMSKENLERLAASGNAGAILLTASYKMEDEKQTTKGDPDMDMTPLVAELSSKTSELTTKTIELSAVTAKVTTLTSEVEALKTAVAEKDAKIKSLEEGKDTSVTELEAKVSDLETKLTAAYDKIIPHAKAALVASGVAEADLPKDLATTVDLIVEKGLKLHQVIGSTAVSDGSKTDEQTETVARHKGSFKLS